MKLGVACCFLIVDCTCKESLFSFSSMRNVNIIAKPSTCAFDVALSPMSDPISSSTSRALSCLLFVGLFTLAQWMGSQLQLREISNSMILWQKATYWCLRVARLQPQNFFRWALIWHCANRICSLHRPSLFYITLLYSKHHITFTTFPNHNSTDISSQGLWNDLASSLVLNRPGPHPHTITVAQGSEMLASYGRSYNSSRERNQAKAPGDWNENGASSEENGDTVSQR